MSRFAPTLSPQEQDLSSIKTGDWPLREFPLGPRERPTRRQVIFKQSVLNDIYGHGQAAPEVEVCGVLVGNVYKDAQGPFVFIEANIRGNFSAGKAAQVTFTAKTWSHIQDVMDKSYPELRILGWYHTHPGHGIFLSDMDLFIHKNFFSLPWHVAFVYDPQHQEEGLFAWRSGNMAIESFVVQKDATPQTKVARRVPELPAHHATTSQESAAGLMPPGGNGDGAAAAMAITTAGPSAPAMMTSPAAIAAALVPATAAPDYSAPLVNNTRPAGAPAEVLDLSIRVQSLERRQRWMTAGMALAVLVAVAWPLALAAYAMLHPQQAAPGEGTSPALKLPDPGTAAEAPPPGASGSAAAPAPPSPASPAAAPTDVAREAAAH